MSGNDVAVPSRWLGSLLLGASLACGMIVSSTLITRTVLRTRMVDESIRVKGTAERRITSDFATWNCSFIARDASQVQAYERLKQDLVKVLENLRAMGVKDEEIEVAAVNTQMRYKLNDKGNATNDIEQYQLRQTITVGSTDVHRVMQISKKATDLISQGIELTSGSPEFFYTRLESLKIDLLGDATRNARERAEQLAVNSRSRVGRLRSASQGVFQITPPLSTEISDYGRNDTSTIEKAARAVVTIEFGVH